MSGIVPPSPTAPTIPNTAAGTVATVGVEWHPHPLSPHWHSFMNPKVVDLATKRGLVFLDGALVTGQGTAGTPTRIKLTNLFGTTPKRTKYLMIQVFGSDGYTGVKFSNATTTFGEGSNYGMIIPEYGIMCLPMNQQDLDKVYIQMQSGSNTIVAYLFDYDL